MFLNRYEVQRESAGCSVTLSDDELLKRVICENLRNCPKRS